MATSGHSYTTDLEQRVEHETVVTIKLVGKKTYILPFLMLLCIGFCTAITIQIRSRRTFVVPG